VQVGLITEDTLVLRRSDNKAIFCYVVDAFGLDKDMLAEANMTLVMAGHACKRGAARTADGRLVVTGFRLCRHDNTMAKYTCLCHDTTLPAQLVLRLPEPGVLCTAALPLVLKPVNT
jgi:hypothetical protein